MVVKADNTEFAINIVEKFIKVLSRHIRSTKEVEKGGYISLYSLKEAQKIDKFKAEGLKTYNGTNQEKKDDKVFTIFDVLKYYEIINEDIQGSQEIFNTFDKIDRKFSIPSPTVPEQEAVLSSNPELSPNALGLITQIQEPEPEEPEPAPSPAPSPAPAPAPEAAAAAAQTEGFITGPADKQKKYVELTGLVRQRNQLTDERAITPDFSEASEKINDLMIQLNPLPSRTSRRNVSDEEYKEKKEKYTLALKKAIDIQRLYAEIDEKTAKLAYKEEGVGGTNSTKIVEDKIKSKMDLLRIQEVSGSNADKHIEYLTKKDKVLGEMIQELNKPSGGGKKKRTHNKKKRRSKKKSTPVKKKK